MRKIFFLLAVLTAPYALLAQGDAGNSNNAGKDNNGVVPAIVKKARDMVMVQIAYTNWVQKPDTVQTKAFGYSFNAYLFYDLPISHSNVSFAVGLGINASAVYPEQVLVESASQPKQLDFRPDTVDFKRYKFVTSYLTVPLEFRYFADKQNRNKGFKISVGGTAGLLLDAHTKATIGIDGTNVKYKEGVNSFATPLNLAATLRVGWGNFALFASYNLTNLFLSSATAPITPASAGICLLAL